MNAALALSLLVTLAFAVACVSWLQQARVGSAFPRDASLAMAGWAGSGFLIQLLASARPDLPMTVAALLTFVSACVALFGLVLISRFLVLDGPLGPAAAEATLAGASVVAVGWGVAGPDLPLLDAVVPLALLILACIIAALIARTLVFAPSLVLDTRYRHKIATGLVSASAFVVADAVLLMVSLGAHIPLGVAAVAAAIGALCAAAGPWVGQAPPRPRGPQPAAVRLLPYLLLAAAALAQVVAAARGALGIVTLCLVGLVVLSLTCLQALVLRDNARLATDLEYSRARLAALVENAGDVILGLDGTGRVVAANAAAASLLQRPPAVLVGLDVSQIAVPSDRERVRAAVGSVVTGLVASARSELTLEHPATGTAELRLRGVPGGAVANLSDVTEAVELRERLARMARYDPMTGLANRAHLQEELRRWLDDRRTLSVLYLDLDGFKAVNDRFGHAAGDAVLTDVAHRLVGAAGSMPASRSIVARMGGDEFVIALLDVPVSEALKCAEGVVSAMRPTFTLAERPVRIGVSVGAAGSGDGASGRAGLRGADDLLHRADIAMYAAKESGRAGHVAAVSWDVALEEQAMRKVDIAIGLRRALETGRLALAYQPIVRLSDGVIVAVEALIRLPRPGQSADDVAAHLADEAPGSLSGLADLVSPAELVEVAEGTGEIDELGRWVLAEATHQASLWQTMKLDVRVNVNMSVRQLSDPGFVDAVRAALAAARLAPHRLVVEITEGQLLGEGHRANETLQRLRADGVQLAIDDFGSGYASLSYLRRMPVRTVKIDRTLLEGIGVDPRATTLVRAVIGAARGLGMQVVCEGIETMAMARFLRDLGAWAGQGFALYGAVSSSELLDVLERPPLRLIDPPRRTGPQGRTDPLGRTDPPHRDQVADQPVVVSHHETRSSRD